MVPAKSSLRSRARAATLLTLLFTMAYATSAHAKLTVSATFQEVDTVRDWTLFEGSALYSRIELVAPSSGDVYIAHWPNNPWTTAKSFLIEASGTSAHYERAEKAFRTCAQMALIAQARPERYELYVLVRVDGEDMSFSESSGQVKVVFDDGYIDCRTIRKE